MKGDILPYVSLSDKVKARSKDLREQNSITTSMMAEELEKFLPDIAAYEGIIAALQEMAGLKPIEMVDTGKKVGGRIIYDVRDKKPTKKRV